MYFAQHTRCPFNEWTSQCKDLTKVPPECFESPRQANTIPELVRGTENDGNYLLRSQDPVFDSRHVDFVQHLSLRGESEPEKVIYTVLTTLGLQSQSLRSRVQRLAKTLIENATHLQTPLSLTYKQLYDINARDTHQVCMSNDTSITLTRWSVDADSVGMFLVLNAPVCEINKRRLWQSLFWETLPQSVYGQHYLSMIGTGFPGFQPEMWILLWKSLIFNIDPSFVIALKATSPLAAFALDTLHVLPNHYPAILYLKCVVNREVDMKLFNSKSFWTFLYTEDPTCEQLYLPPKSAELNILRRLLREESEVKMFTVLNAALSVASWKGECISLYRYANGSDSSIVPVSMAINAAENFVHEVEARRAADALMQLSATGTDTTNATVGAPVQTSTSSPVDAPVSMPVVAPISVPVATAVGEAVTASSGDAIGAPASERCASPICAPISSAVANTSASVDAAIGAPQGQTTTAESAPVTTPVAALVATSVAAPVSTPIAAPIAAAPVGAADGVPAVVSAAVDASSAGRALSPPVSSPVADATSAAVSAPAISAPVDSSAVKTAVGADSTPTSSASAPVASTVAADVGGPVGGQSQQASPSPPVQSSTDAAIAANVVSASSEDRPIAQIMKRPLQIVPLVAYPLYQKQMNLASELRTITQLLGCDRTTISMRSDTRDAKFDEFFTNFRPRQQVTCSQREKMRIFTVLALGGEKFEDVFQEEFKSNRELRTPVNLNKLSVLCREIIPSLARGTMDGNMSWVTFAEKFFDNKCLTTLDPSSQLHQNIETAKMALNRHITQECSVPGASCVQSFNTSSSRGIISNSGSGGPFVSFSPYRTTYPATIASVEQLVAEMLCIFDPAWPVLWNIRQTSRPNDSWRQKSKTHEFLVQFRKNFSDGTVTSGAWSGYTLPSWVRILSIIMLR